MKKIAAIGEILWDNFPDGKILGGAPTNFAILSKYLGNEAYVISAVGDDDLGKEIFDKLQNWGICTSLLQITKEYDTGEVMVQVDEQGIPRYQIVENRASDHIKYSDEMNNFLNEFDAISFGSLSSRSMESKNTIFEFLRKLSDKCLKVCDLNIRKNYYNKELIESLLKISDIFKINENEQALLEKIFEIKLDEPENIRYLMKNYNIEVIIITNGDVDSEIILMNDYSRIPSKKVDVVDTVGAGDSFLAAFVDGYLKNLPLAQNHQRAVELSSEVCKHKGATGILNK